MLSKIIRRVKEQMNGGEDASPKEPKRQTRKKTPAKAQQEVWVPGESAKKKEKGRPSKAPAASRSSEPKKSEASTPTPPRKEGDQPPRKRRRRRRRSSKADAPAKDSNVQSTQDDTQESLSTAYKPKNIEHFEGQLTFSEMDIPDPVKRALDEMHFKVTTPIQAQLLPIALAGRDAAGKAQTGTGKTAAFLISIYTHFLQRPIEGERRNGTPRALILAPTRELALQIQKDAVDIGRYCGFHSVAVYGGMDFDKQQRQLEKPVDIIVATPGRLLDFVNRKVVNLKQVETLVIDEADRMLDMGFIPDVRKIVRMTPHPEKRQTLLFSATLTPNITRLAAQWTRNAETVEIEAEQVAADSVNQRVFITTQEEKFALLYNLLQAEKPERVLIFSNRRDQAEMLHDHLKSYGFTTALLSGAVEQKKRLRVLEDFKAGKVSVLVATDVAGRGLHVESISHVINYHMPLDPEDYVHRIGRTGRAGEVGTSISFACELDSFAIPDIEEYLGQPLSCEHPTEELLKPVPAPDYQVQRRPRRAPGGARGNSGRRTGARGSRQRRGASRR